MADFSIQLKQSDVQNEIPQPADLLVGELLLNTTDEKLYSKNASSVVFQVNKGSDGQSLSFGGVSTTGLSEQIVDTFNLSSTNTVKYSIQITHPTTGIYEISDVFVVANTLGIKHTQYAVLRTGITLATFDTDIVSGVARLKITPTISPLTVSFSKLIVSSDTVEDAAVEFGQVITSGLSITNIDTFVKQQIRSVKYTVQIDDATDYSSAEYTVIHDGTTASVLQSAVLNTGASLGGVTVDINSNDVRLRVTPTVAATTIKFAKTEIRT